MKTRLAICAFLFALSLALFAELPKIAVLDTVIPKGLDTSVQIPITESIIEQMVNSKKYTVLDRANIASIFREKEFQLSGEVTDSDVTKAGQFLGAAFVVVTKVQVIGGTYFVSSKMINVATAVIQAQTSEKYRGDIADLITVAQNVGYKLANGVNEVPQNAIPINTTTTTTTTIQIFNTSSSSDSGSKELPTLRIIADVAFPTFFGDFYDQALKTPADQQYKYAEKPIGLEVYAAWNVDETFYMMVEFDSLKLNLTGISAKTSGASVSDTTSLSVQNFLYGLGVSKNITIGRIYAGAFLGSSHVQVGDFWKNPGLSGDLVAGTTSDQFIFGGELGVAFYLFNFIVIDARARLGTLTPDIDGNSKALNFFNLSVGGGIAF